LESKDHLRKQARQSIKSWCAAPVKEQEQTQLAFNGKLVDFLKGQKGTWAAFSGMPGEPALDLAVSASNHLTWVYPRVENDSLSFWLPKNKQAFVKGAYGILEPDPKSSEQKSLTQINGVLIPGLAFDKAGGRLGRGKAFYDRALQNYQGQKIGTAFSWQIQENIPTEPWDIFMEVLVTDAGVIRCAA